MLLPFENVLFCSTSTHGACEGVDCCGRHEQGVTHAAGRHPPRHGSHLERRHLSVDSKLNAHAEGHDELRCVDVWLADAPALAVVHRQVHAHLGPSEVVVHQVATHAPAARSEWRWSGGRKTHHHGHQRRHAGTQTHRHTLQHAATHRGDTCTYSGDSVPTLSDSRGISFTRGAPHKEVKAECT